MIGQPETRVYILGTAPGRNLVRRSRNPRIYILHLVQPFSNGQRLAETALHCPYEKSRNNVPRRGRGRFFPADAGGRADWELAACFARLKSIGCPAEFFHQAVEKDALDSAHVGLLARVAVLRNPLLPGAVGCRSMEPAVVQPVPDFRGPRVAAVGTSIDQPLPTATATQILHVCPVEGRFDDEKDAIQYAQGAKDWERYAHVKCTEVEVTARLQQRVSVGAATQVKAEEINRRLWWQLEVKAVGNE